MSAARLRLAPQPPPGAAPAMSVAATGFSEMPEVD